MRLFIIPLVLLPVCANAGERTPARGDSARTRSSIQGPGVAPEPLDPAYRQYWSDQCRRERDFGFTQSPDCRHPAYVGDQYGYGPGPGSGYGGRHVPGYPPAPDIVIINRGGTVVLSPPGRNEPPRRGGSMGGWSR